MRETSDLHSGWRLDLVRPATGAAPTIEGVPATVPGCVHTDLMAAGLLDDPYLDRNEDRQHWVGDSDWRYTTDLLIDQMNHSDRLDLVFEGLDTVADVSLDGALVARTRNMHRGYRIDVTDRLMPGTHTLTVGFGAARRYAEQVRDDLGARPGSYGEPFQYLRKMACNFGWDWGPTLVTAGIWRPVRLERWSTARLASVRPEVRVVDGTGLVDVHADLERAGHDVDLVVSARIEGVTARHTVAAGAGSTTLHLRVPDVELWWPHDLGEQPLYQLDVTVYDDRGNPLDEWSRRVGFRTVELDTDPDADGTPFAFAINGSAIFVRGANWIPDDCFPSRITADRLRERLQQAVDANITLLRVWGGGRYESDDFYALCDELGLLVWQDFLFACAAYPEEEPLGSEVEAEARENVVRLMPHPSLVLWNGNNENIWGFHDWDWADVLGDRTWGLGYYTDLLPRVVAELDPTRAYWAGSPYSGSLDVHPNDPAHGTTHIWTVWNDRDYTDYRAWAPRFVAEFGFQGPPTWSTLTRAISDDPLLPTSPGVMAHQKAADGDAKLLRGLAPHLPEPVGTDDWHYLTQLNQARAVAYGLEHFRSLSPLCRGAIVWQLNDCWPVTSWAMVDGGGRRKPLWYAVRRAFAPRLLTVQPRDGRPAAVVVNDGADPWTGTLTLTRRSLTGELLATASSQLEVRPGESTTVVVPMDVATPDEPTRELLVAELGAHRALWFFAEDRDLPLDPAAATVSVNATAEGVDVTVTASSILRDLVLQADRVDPSAAVDEQVVTLLAGDSHTFHVTTTASADDPRWAGPPVLMSVNDLTRETS